MILKLALLTPLIALAAAPQEAALTRNGKPSSVIVVPEGDARVSREAAELLQKTLARMTGAQIPIRSESQAGQPAAPERVWISVGNTRFARGKGITTEAMKPEEIRVMAAPAYVIVAGNDSPADCSGREAQQGTYFAAVELLERLGVRWLWPGKSGEAVPKRATVSVGRLDYAFAPPLMQRHMRFTTRGGEFRYGVDLAAAGLEPGEWPRNMRLGYSRRTGMGHSFGDWYEKYFKTHPEYFAVGEDGKSFGWLNNVSRSKLCVSNPGVQEEVVKLARAHYASCGRPQATFFSLSPTDNQSGHCMCSNCRKLDALDGPEETWNFNTGEGGRTRTLVRYVSLTDRYLTFWNRIAERMEADAPGLLFGGIAYAVYRHPPLHTRAHRNLIIGYVGNDYTNDAVRRSALKDWDGWAARASRLMFRPNLMREGFGFPLVWPLRMAEDIRHFARTGLVAADIANIHGHWATQGLNYYVLAKMLWNPNLDGAAIVDDYCQHGFGKAAGAVRKYYSRLIELTDRLAAWNGEHDGDVKAVLKRVEATAEERPRRGQASSGTGVSAWEAVYTPAAMKELEACLGEARRLAAGDAAVQERVELLFTGFEYAKLDLKMKQAVARYQRDPQSGESGLSLLKALVELEQWRKRNAATPAVGITSGYSWFGLQLAGTPAARFVAAVVPRKLPGGDYELDVLAFSPDKRLTQMQLSSDGREWSAARPYEPRIAWRGQGQVHVRFYLEGERGSEWSKPVHAGL